MAEPIKSVTTKTNANGDQTVTVVESTPRAATTTTRTGGTTTGSSGGTSSSNTRSNSSTVSANIGWNQRPDLVYDPNTHMPTQESINAAVNKFARDYANATRLSEAIGVNRDKLRAERAKEALLNQKRAKVAAWTESARVLSDILSAGIGGNVYARNADTTAKEMQQRNTALRELQAAEDAQAAMQDWQNNKEAALAVMNFRNRLMKDAAVNNSSSNSRSTGDSNTNGKNSSSSSSTAPTTTTTYNGDQWGGTGTNYANYWGGIFGQGS